MTHTSAHPALHLPPVGTLIAGRWLTGEHRLPVHDKYGGHVIAHDDQATREQVADAVAATHAASQRALLAPVDRARVLRTTADLLERDRAALVDLMIAEAGFTQADAQNEVDRAKVTLQLSAEEATRLVGETVCFGASAGQHGSDGAHGFPVGDVVRLCGAGGGFATRCLGRGGPRFWARGCS